MLSSQEKFTSPNLIIFLNFFVFFKKINNSASFFLMQLITALQIAVSALKAKLQSFKSLQLKLNETKVPKSYL